MKDNVLFEVIFSKIYNLSAAFKFISAPFIYFVIIS